MSRAAALIVMAALVLALALAAGPAAAQAPDLVVTAASKARGPLVVGSRLRIRAAVANRGGGSAAGSQTGLYLSTNAAWSSSDIELAGSGSTRALAARGRARVRARARVPRGAPTAQRFRLLACADVRNEVAEADEGNNCRAAGSLVVVGGSSFDVIDADVQRRRLKPSRALLYKLYAVFGDRRLPKRYRGDGSRVEGTSLIRDARERLPSLPPAIRGQVRRFLIPPAYRGSFKSKAAAASVSGGAAGEGLACGVRSPDWTSVVTDNGLARVWWQTSTGNAANARRLKRVLVDTIWPKLTAVMNHQPLSDKGMRCGGPDDKLDVYLSPMGTPEDAYTHVFLDSCSKPSPSYVVVDPSAPLGVLAHEFMHVLEFTYKRAGACWRWEYVDDAVATWAEEYADHGGQTEHEYPYLVTEPSIGFGKGNLKGIGYWGWAFMYSATQHAGGPALVRRIYELGAGIANPLEALDAALPRGFESAWPAFAKDAWNRPLPPSALKESFFNWDAWGVRPWVRPRPFKLVGKQREEPLPIELAGLTRQYYDLRFSDTTAREITFKDPSAVGSDPQLRTWAFIKIAREGWKAEDWTGRDKVEFCRDSRAEDVRQVVLVHSTSRRPGLNGRVTRSTKPKLRLKNRCRAEAFVILSGREVYTVQHTDCKPTEQTVMNWQLNGSFDLPGRVERGLPDPVEAAGGAGSGSLAIDAADPDAMTDCPPLKHTTHQLKWRGDEGLTLRLLPKGAGLEIELRMIYGFLGVDDPDLDQGIFGLGLGPDPFEDGICKEIHGVIPQSKVRDRRIEVPVSGTCDVRFGPENLQHSILQANGTLVITQ